VISFYALAAIAIHDGISETAVAVSKKNTAVNPAQKPTIINQYARLCALQIIDQKQYQPEQLRTLFRQFTKYAGEVEFHHRPQQREGNQYSVGEKSPPALNEFRYHKQSDSKLLYFSIDALLRKIDSTEEKNATSGIFNNNSRSRRESRSPRAGLITAENGLKEIHTLIKLAPPTEKPESQFTDIQQLLQQEPTLESPAPSDTLNSVNTTDFGAAFDVENQSSNGFGLKWRGTGSCKLQNGELLAHCYRSNNNETSWHLAVVRWLNTNADNTLSLGVETISRHTTAVDIFRLYKGEQQMDKPAEGLLVNYQPIDSKAKMLILPMHKYMAGETVGYHDHHGFQLAKLIEIVNLEGNFQCFAISSIEQEISHSEASDAAVREVAVP